MGMKICIREGKKEDSNNAGTQQKITRETKYDRYTEEGRSGQRGRGLITH